MTWDAFMHMAGCVCLFAITGIGAWSLYSSLVPNWHRIWPRAMGRVIMDHHPDVIELRRRSGAKAIREPIAVIDRRSARG